MVLGIVGILLAPALFSFFDEVLRAWGVPPIIPMTVGEYSSYFGTVATILCAALLFWVERRERAKEADRQKREERPRLEILLHSSGLISVSNVGAFKAINLTNCDEFVTGVLNPGATIELLWDDSSECEGLTLSHGNIIRLSDYVIETRGGLSLDLFAYSEHGVLWQYACTLKADGKTQIIVEECWY